MGRAATGGNAALVSREVAIRELAGLGADVEYATHVLPDGSDPPGRVRTVRFPAGACTDDALRFVGAFPEIEELELSGQSSVSDRALRRLPHLENLRSLTLSGTRVTGEGLGALGTLPKLEALYVEGLSLDEGAFRRIATFARLRTLRVDRTSIDDARLMLLAPLKELGYVGVFDTAVTAAGAEALNRVLPGVTVHRFKGQSDPPHSDVARATDWSRHMVKPTLLWPSNFLTGTLWGGQRLEYGEIVKVLDQRLPAVDKENADRPLFEVVAAATKRAIVWVPARPADDAGRARTYGKVVGARAAPPTVGELFSGLLTGMSEAGGPRGVSMVGRPPGACAAVATGPYLIYTLYVTRSYIAIVALPADGE